MKTINLFVFLTLACIANAKLSKEERLNEAYDKFQTEVNGIPGVEVYEESIVKELRKLNLKTTKELEVLKSKTCSGWNLFRLHSTTIECACLEYLLETRAISAGSWRE